MPQQINPTHISFANTALANGHPLLITGPQGCGKSTLARLVAGQRGAFLGTHVNHIVNKQKFAGLLLRRPKTLIVDEFELLADWLKKEASRATFKQMLSSVELCAVEKGKLVRIATPRLIFCTANVDFPQDVTINRRFHVLQMGVTE